MPTRSFLIIKIRFNRKISFIQKSWSLEYISEKSTPESESAIGFKKSGSYRKMLLLRFLCILFCENETFRI